MGTIEQKKRVPYCSLPCSGMFLTNRLKNVSRHRRIKKDIRLQICNLDEQMDSKDKIKFEIFGKEMISKEVTQSGLSGRVYLPQDWIGRHIKIILVD